MKYSKAITIPFGELVNTKLFFLPNSDELMLKISEYGDWNYVSTRTGVQHSIKADELIIPVQGEFIIHSIGI